jgi:hypothetical protein
MYREDNFGGRYGAGRYHDLADLIRKGCLIYPKKAVGRFRGWNSACALGALVAGTTEQRDFFGFSFYLEDFPELNRLINLDEPWRPSVEVSEACVVCGAKNKREAVKRFVWRFSVLVKAFFTADDLEKAWTIAHKVMLRAEYSRYARLVEIISLVNDTTKYSREAIADWLCLIGGCIHPVKQLEKEIPQNRDNDFLSLMVASSSALVLRKEI